MNSDVDMNYESCKECMRPLAMGERIVVNTCAVVTSFPTSRSIKINLDRSSAELFCSHGCMLNFNMKKNKKPSNETYKVFDGHVATPAVQWANVKIEGCPKDKMECLLTWDDGNVTTGWYMGGGVFQHANGENDYHMDINVDWWAPNAKPMTFPRTNDLEEG